MKIYSVTQNSVSGYNTYDSAVIIAESKKEAVLISINELCNQSKSCPSWPYTAESILAVELGEAKAGLKSGIIVSSFNAG